MGCTKTNEGMTLIWILYKPDSGKNHFWDQKGNRRGGACYRSAATVASVRWDSGAALVSPCCGYSGNIYKQTDMMFHLLWNTRAKWKTGKLEEKPDYRKLTTTTTTTNGYLFTTWECCRLTTHPDTSKQQPQQNSGHERGVGVHVGAPVSRPIFLHYLNLNANITSVIFKGNIPSAYFKIISLFIHRVNSVSTCREPLKRDGFQKDSEIRLGDKKKCSFTNTSISDTGWLTKQLAMASDSTLESQLLLLIGVDAGCCFLLWENHLGQAYMCHSWKPKASLCLWWLSGLISSHPQFWITSL